MKVKLATRRPEDFEKARAGDVPVQPRNLDPAMHPMERATEYHRAVQAAKMDRMFAAPLRCALEGLRCTRDCVCGCAP